MIIQSRGENREFKGGKNVNDRNKKKNNGALFKRSKFNLYCIGLRNKRDDS